MKPIVRRGPRAGDLGDGEPARSSRTSSSTWAVLGEDPRGQAVAPARATTSRPSASGSFSAGADERDPQGVALHQVRLLRLGVQLDGVRPRVPRPGGARQGVPLRRRPARPGRRRAARGVQRRARDLGLHALLLLQRALPEGRRPARRDRQARRRVDQARGSTATWARSTRSGSSHSAKTTGWLRETELVPKTQGIVECDQADEVRAQARASTARCRRRSRRTWPTDVKESRALYDLVQGAGPRRRRRHRPGREGARAASSSPRTRGESARDRSRARRRRRMKSRLLQGLPRLAVGEGARHLDAGARAEARARARRARVGHVLRRRRHPRGRARLLPAPERADPRLRRGDRRRHADDDLQRLHAQPAPGELAAEERRRRCARA